MAITLMPLPYADDALEPDISKDTLATHHGAHHKGYVDKVNDAIRSTALARASLEEIVRAAHAQDDKKLFNNAAQAWNHGFYWHSLTPDRSRPSEALSEAIVRDFGSQKALNDALTEEATAHFASGWAWLVAADDRLEVISTHDAATPLTGPARPLLTIDIWEHAYYLDVKNKRPDYVKAVVENRLNWAFASENYQRAVAWAYPQPVPAE